MKLGIVETKLFLYQGKTKMRYEDRVFDVSNSRDVNSFGLVGIFDEYSWQRKEGETSVAGEEKNSI